MSYPAFVNQPDPNADLSAIRSALQAILDLYEPSGQDPNLPDTFYLVTKYNATRPVEEWINGWTADLAYPPEERKRTTR